MPEHLTRPEEHGLRKPIIRLLLVAAIIMCTSAAVRAQEQGEAGDGSPKLSYKMPFRYGMAVSLGHSAFLPEDQNYGMAMFTFIGLFDYDRIWPHNAPDPLRFKVELTGGSTTWPDAPRAIVSAKMLALYYLESLRSEWAIPYVEAGIGGIYTDFQVDGQGSRINFNPVAGIGVEFLSTSGPSFFTSLRLHHLSNAHLLPHNQGLNSAFMMFGMYF